MSKNSLNIQQREVMNEKKLVVFPLFLADVQKTIQCRANGDDSLWTLKREILKTPDTLNIEDGLNYGFFLAPFNGRVGKYLDEARAIKEYPEKDLKRIEFRYKQKYYKDLPRSAKKFKTINDASHRKSFFHLIESSKSEEVIKMLKKDHDPNHKDPISGETPLTCAILNKCPPQLIVSLVENGAHLDYRNKAGNTPAHVSALSGNFDALKTLLDLGASPNVRNQQNLTPLYAVMKSTDSENFNISAKLLLEYYSIVDVVDEGGSTELHHACRLGRIQAVKRLIMYGSNINHQNFTGNTPLHVAIFNNQELVVRKLLTYGANKEISNHTNLTPHASALTVGNDYLADYILNFTPDQQVKIVEEPTYHPTIRAKPTRRPSFLSFIERQNKEIEREKKFKEELVKLEKAKKDESLRNKNINESIMHYKEEYPKSTFNEDSNRSTDLVNEDSLSVTKYGTINEYISKMFHYSEYSDNDSSYTTNNDSMNTSNISTEKGTNNYNFSDSLLVPSLKYMSISDSALKRNSQNSGSNMSNRSVRAIKNMNAHKNENGKGSHTSLLIFSMPQNMSSRSTNSSPLKNLEQHDIFGAETKVASIRHYPKRLMTSHPNLSIDNENDNNLASTTYESANLKHSSLKKYDHSRPKLFNIFKRNPSPNFNTMPTPIKPIPSTSQTLETSDKKPPSSCFPKPPMPFTSSKPPRKKNNIQTQNKISENHKYDILQNSTIKTQNAEANKNNENSAQTNIEFVENDNNIYEEIFANCDFPPPPPEFANDSITENKSGNINANINNDKNDSVVLRRKKLPSQNIRIKSSRPHQPPPLPQRTTSRPMSSFFGDQQISLTTLGDANSGIYSNTQHLNFNSNETNLDDFKSPEEAASIYKKRLSFQEEKRSKNITKKVSNEDNFQFPEPPAFLTPTNNSKRLNRNSYLSEQNAKINLNRQPSYSSYSELYENRKSLEPEQISSHKTHSIYLEETIPRKLPGSEFFNQEKSEVTGFRFVPGKSVPVDSDISRRTPVTQQNLNPKPHNEIICDSEDIFI